MGTRVWKYQLELTERQGLKMPDGAVILSAHTQTDSTGKQNICIWVAVDSEAPSRQRVIKVAATGEDALLLPLDVFVGTVQVGPFVFHVFDGGWQ